MKHGFVIIGPNGRVLTDGFGDDFAPEAKSCRETTIVQMEWAIERLRQAIARAQTEPYEGGLCAIDFSKPLTVALESESWFKR